LFFSADDKTATHKYAGAPFYAARKYLMHLYPGARKSLVALEGFDFKSDAWAVQLCAPFEPRRSAVLVLDGVVQGVVGEFKAKVSKGLKLPAYTAGFEVNLAVLMNATKASYIPLPTFPKTSTFFPAFSLIKSS
jgi:hypothetical protein